MSAADRELLELAAKAVGLKWIEPTSDGLPWNPLVDDGYALRLAVKLEMNITREKDCETGSIDVVVISHCEIRNVEETEGDDPYAATRRAIVRAAAEIGRAAA